MTFKKQPQSSAVYKRVFKLIQYRKNPLESLVEVFACQQQKAITRLYDVFSEHLNLEWRRLFWIRFCHPSVDFSAGERADTDPAARLLDGRQEGVVPLVLQEALLSGAETEGEASVWSQTNRTWTGRRRTESRQPSSVYKKHDWWKWKLGFYVLQLITLFKCYFAILRSASILKASQHGRLSTKLPPILRTFPLKMNIHTMLTHNLFKYIEFERTKRECAWRRSGKDLLRKTPINLPLFPVYKVQLNMNPIALYFWTYCTFRKVSHIGATARPKHTNTFKIL